MYAIIDIETTGGNPKRGDRITEIAIFIHDGQRVVDQFVSLVNPERMIPAFITGLTGISNEMVEDAPKFQQIARRVVELTQGCVFVAHNVSFDYGFVAEEFRSLGYDFRRDQLCTVRLSRKLFPCHASYSLGKLCADLRIPLSDRHRAAGDALATVALFERLLAREGELGVAKGTAPAIGLQPQKDWHPDLDPKDVAALPSTTGVYYFYDQDGELIYVGKSKDIKKRVLSHLASKAGQKALEMKARVAAITCEETGSELVALLLESDQIKRHKPLYNRAQRRSLYNFGLFDHYDQRGYHCLSVRKIQGQQMPLTAFGELREGREKLERWARELQLCQKLCGLFESGGACFDLQVRQCKGACVGQEAPEEYNARVDKLLARLAFARQDFLVVEKGRDLRELAVVLVRGGRYVGFGFIQLFEAHSDPELLADCVKPYPDNQDVRRIIAGHLLRAPEARVVPL